MLRLENTDAHTTQNILRHHLNRKPENIWAECVSNVMNMIDNLRNSQMDIKDIIMMLKSLSGPEYNVYLGRDSLHFRVGNLHPNSINEEVIHCAKLPYMEDIAVWYTIRRARRYQAGDTQPLFVTLVNGTLTMSSTTDVNAIEVFGVTREDGTVHITPEEITRATALLLRMYQPLSTRIEIVGILSSQTRRPERRETVRGRITEMFVAYPYTTFGSPNVNVTRLPAILRDVLRGQNRPTYLSVYKGLFVGILARSLSNKRQLIRESLVHRNVTQLVHSTTPEIERALNVWRNIIRPHLVEVHNAD